MINKLWHVKIARVSQGHQVRWPQVRNFCGALFVEWVFCWMCPCACPAHRGDDVKDCPIFSVTWTASSSLTLQSQSQAPHPQCCWSRRSVYSVCWCPLSSLCCPRTVQNSCVHWWLATRDSAITNLCPVTGSVSPHFKHVAVLFSKM